MTRHRLGALAGLALALGLGFWHALPEPLFDVPVASVLLARDGTLLGGRIAEDEQWRFPPMKRVPEKFETAILAFEDKRFKSHPGVDPLALGRALYLAVINGKVTSGASTLTMQVMRLARNNRGRERTVVRKLVEMALALRLELSYEKDEILALYASHAPFGGNVVGLEAASWRYFGRPPERLSWAESSMLAVLPNAPALIHPGRRRDALRTKRDTLLRKLHANGTFSDLDLALALREPLPDKPHPLPRSAPHLLETLRASGGNPRYQTTLNAELQKAATAIVAEHVARLKLQGIHNAAALIVNNVDFEVLAYVGNAEWSLDNDLGYAVDVVKRPRSTGSILKPLLFAAMLESGDVLPTTLVPDVPTQYAGYMPENYDRAYRGAVPADVALARSLNVPAVRLLHQYGIDRFYDFMKHFGMTTLNRRPDAYGLTLILGGAETTLWDMAGIYSNLADIARHAGPGTRRPYQALKILVDDTSKTERMAELSSGAAWLALDALVDVKRPGDSRFWRHFASSRIVGWKTGTSYGLRDGWAIGTTPSHTVAVWVGNASGEGRPGLTGSATAAPILFDLINRLDPEPWFRTPYLHMKQVEVCKNDGYLAGGGCETELLWVPKNSHFEKVSTFNRRVHLDAAGRARVTGACEAPGRMSHRSWFVLPARLEYYYRKHHAEYRPLPKFREDCRLAAGIEGASGPIAFLYPNAGTKLYIPTDLARQRGATVFEAVHRRPDATLFWHLDDVYLGSTKTFHQQGLDMTPGKHVVTVVDETGNRLSRRFQVLGAEEQVLVRTSSR